MVGWVGEEDRVGWDRVGWDRERTGEKRTRGFLVGDGGSKT